MQNDSVVEALDMMDTQTGKMLTFAIGNELYSIDIRYVTEIIGIQDITAMPEMPDYIKGIINLRGRIIPVMDVRLRFKAEAKPYDDRTCVIVVEINDLGIGLIVDNVSEVITIEEENILEVPQVSTDVNRKFVKNIGKVDKNVILILDCESLLSEDEMTEIMQ